MSKEVFMLTHRINIDLQQIILVLVLILKLNNNIMNQWKYMIGY